MATKFRTSFTSTEGAEPALTVQGRIVNINLVTWTVDVVAQFDRKRYFDIQVGSPYMHHAKGEGFFAFPEVGATCMVTIPSDSAPPFVSTFVMAHEIVDDSSTEAPMGTTSHSDEPLYPTTASFAGGRPKPKPGDLGIRGRDGNFAILHRGGVLQLGSTELAQRFYIPLNNLVVDFAENYEQHSAGGSILWGIQDGPTISQFPTQYIHTFRVFANDKYADVRVTCGKVQNPMPEPDGGIRMAEAGVGQGSDNPILFEVAVSPKGFVAESGDLVGPQTTATSVFKFVFDRKGNILLRTEGNLLLHLKKKLTLRVTEDVLLQTEASGSLLASNGFTMDGGTFSHIKGKVVRLGQGQIPVARLGDVVSTILAASPCLIQFFSPPIPGAPIQCAITTQAPMIGSISSGNQQVLA